MKKFVLILLLLFLAACGGAETVAEPTAEPVDEAIAVDADNEAAEETAVIEPTATTEVVPTETAIVEEESEEEAETGETTGALSPQEVLAAARDVRTEDWAKGSTEPLITIIEYGDFQ